MKYYACFTLLLAHFGSGDVQDQEPDDDLHVYIVADNEEQCQKATRLVEDLLFNPEKRNAIKQNQLRKVAEYNGTLRDDGTSFVVLNYCVIFFILNGFLFFFSSVITVDCCC